MPERFISYHFLLCLLIPVWKDLVRVGVETEGAKDRAQDFPLTIESKLRPRHCKRSRMVMHTVLFFSPPIISLVRSE